MPRMATTASSVMLMTAWSVDMGRDRTRTEPRGGIRVAGGHHGAMPTAVVILPSGTYRAADFVTAADRLGVDLIVASDSGGDLGELTGEGVLAVDCGDDAAAAEAIVGLAAARTIDAVVAADDQGVVIAALAARRLGLPHNDPGAAAATRDKSVMRARLEAGGVPQPAVPGLGRRRPSRCGRDRLPVRREAPAPVGQPGRDPGRRSGRPGDCGGPDSGDPRRGERGRPPAAGGRDRHRGHGLATDRELHRAGGHRPLGRADRRRGRDRVAEHGCLVRAQRQASVAVSVTAWPGATTWSEVSDAEPAAMPVPWLTVRIVQKPGWVLAHSCKERLTCCLPPG